MCSTHPHTGKIFGHPEPGSLLQRGPWTKLKDPGYEVANIPANHTSLQSVLLIVLVQPCLDQTCQTQL